MVSVDRDGILKVWDLQGVELTSIPAHSGPISECAAVRESRTGDEMPTTSLSLQLPFSPLPSDSVSSRRPAWNRTSGGDCRIGWGHTLVESTPGERVGREVGMWDDLPVDQYSRHTCTNTSTVLPSSFPPRYFRHKSSWDTVAQSMQLPFQRLLAAC